MTKLLDYAKQLRRDSTVLEMKLWSRLRDRRLGGFKFRRQYWIEKYIVDFVCIELKVIVELDGYQHAEQITYDTKRTEFLRQRGFKVLRFWNNQLNEDFDTVMEKIYLELQERVNK